MAALASNRHKLTQLSGTRPCINLVAGQTKRRDTSWGKVPLIRTYRHDMTKGRERHPEFSFGIDPEEGPDTPGRRGKARGIVVAGAILVLLVTIGAYVYVYPPDYVRGVLQNTPLELPATITHAYKWQAADGTWHITDAPPPDGIEYEKMTVRSDTNIVPATPTSDE